VFSGLTKYKRQPDFSNPTPKSARSLLTSSRSDSGGDCLEGSEQQKPDLYPPLGSDDKCD
jgi:hypothetical protein